jgi:lipopolysaccharide biosynthesis glycosyltransferase
MLCSLLEHNAVFRIHLFYSSIKDDQLKELKSFVAEYGSTILCYEMDATKFRNLRVDEHVSIATYYRVLATQILPSNLDKAIYLDSDLIVIGSLADLWNIDLNNHALAAVKDQYISDCDIERLTELGLPPEASYFNGGVLLINLTFWRRHSVSDRAIAYARNHPDKVKWWDQDALNVILVDHWMEIPSVWNLQCWDCDKLFSELNDVAVVHFSGPVKPWHWSMKHTFKSEYRKYRLKTPWPRYRLEDKPSLYHRLRIPLRNLVRTVLPVGMRRRLLSVRERLRVKRSPPPAD